MLVKARTPSSSQSIKEKIQQRRYQILVHSLIYYELDYNIITDEQWSKWAKELEELQSKHPMESSQVIFADKFKDFIAGSGYYLDYRDERIINIAYRLLLLKGEKSVAERLKLVPVNSTQVTKSKKATKEKVKNDSKIVRKGLFKIARN